MDPMRVAAPVIAVAMLVARASADPAAAVQLATDATQLANRGDFLGAAAKFAEAYKQDPTRHDLFCNVGVAYFKASRGSPAPRGANDRSRAHLLLNRCLERTLEPSDLAKLRGVLASVENELRAGEHAPVTINVSPTASSVRIPELLPGEEAFVGTRVVWLPFGHYTLEVHAEGHVDRSEPLEITSKEPRSISIALERRSPVKPLDRPPDRRAVPETHVEQVPRSKVAPIAATGVAVVAGVLAVVAFHKAHSAADLASDALTNDDFESDVEQVDRWNTVFGIGMPVAVLGAGLAGYLWYRATRTTTTRVEVGPTAGGASLSLSRRF